jgi:hypothetical protein
MSQTNTIPAAAGGLRMQLGGVQVVLPPARTLAVPLVMLLILA